MGGVVKSGVLVEPCSDAALAAAALDPVPWGYVDSPLGLLAHTRWTGTLLSDHCR